MTDTATQTLRWHATVTAELRRVMVDAVEEVSYDDGRFLARRYIVPAPPGDWTEMSAQALSGVADDLRAQLDNAPEGVDTRTVQAFLALIPAPSL